MHDKIFKSEILTFVVGEKKERFMIHSGAIAQYTSWFDELINLSLEGEAKTIECADIEAEDFVRLCQFAYTGDYSPSGHEGPGNSSKADKQHEKAEESDENTPRLYERKSKKKKSIWEIAEESKLDTLRAAFKSRKYQAPILCQLVTDDNSILLCHARLYVLGDKYGIDSLTSLVLHKLHKSLVQIHLSNSRVGDVLQLARFIYQNTEAHSENPLRDLATSYIAANIHSFGKSADFCALLEEGTRFGSDIWRLIYPLISQDGSL